ncbi:hypothetical protein ABZ618_00360 [Streptomyces roseolus]|uniref:hypothetical protein n=1 Tax=Streptomyces roseolus TaxID=67358 RepID=UPI0033D7EC65
MASSSPAPWFYDVLRRGEGPCGGAGALLQAVAAEAVGTGKAVAAGDDFGRFLLSGPARLRSPGERSSSSSSLSSWPPSRRLSRPRPPLRGPLTTAQRRARRPERSGAAAARCFTGGNKPADASTTALQLIT